MENTRRNRFSILMEKWIISIDQMERYNWFISIWFGLVFSLWFFAFHFISIYLHPFRCDVVVEFLIVQIGNASFFSIVHHETHSVCNDSILNVTNPLVAGAWFRVNFYLVSIAWWTSTWLIWPINPLTQCACNAWHIKLIHAESIGIMSLCRAHLFFFRLLLLQLFWCLYAVFTSLWIQLA